MKYIHVDAGGGSTNGHASAYGVGVELAGGGKVMVGDHSLLELWAQETLCLFARPERCLDIGQGIDDGRHGCWDEG